MLKIKGILITGLILGVSLLIVANNFTCAPRDQITVPTKSPSFVPDSSPTPALKPVQSTAKPAEIPIPPKPSSLLCSDSEYNSLYTVYRSWGLDFSIGYNQNSEKGIANNWTWFWMGHATDENKKLYFYLVGDQWKPGAIPTPSLTNSPSLSPTTKEPINKLFILNELTAARSQIKTILSTYPVKASDNSSYGAVSFECTMVNLQNSWWYRKIPTKDLEEAQKHITNPIDLLNETSGQLDPNKLLTEVSAIVTSLNTQDIVIQSNKVGAANWIKGFNDNTQIDKKAVDKLSPDYINSCVESVTIFCDNISADVNHISERLKSVIQHINERK